MQIFNFLASIIAGVISYYICEWLDKKIKTVNYKECLWIIMI